MTHQLKELGGQLALCAMHVENIFPHQMDRTSIREADICATLLATSEMMDRVDPKWWPQQEPTTYLQHCYRSLGRQKIEKAAVQCTDYTL